MNKTKTICRQICKKQAKNNRYNILTYATHEGYQSLLDKTGHNFYLIDRPDGKKWESKYRELPPNHYEISQWYDDLNIDFILSQERFGQLQFSLDLTLNSRLPIIHIDHTEPQDDIWNDFQKKELRDLKADINVSITKYNKESWGEKNSIVIPHGIDTEVFNGWSNFEKEKKYILYVVNFLEGRDHFCGHTQWLYIKNKIQENHPEIEFRLVGDNPGISSPINNINSLVSQYNNCIAYINTSQLSPIPMSLLEAMSCGVPVFSSAKQEIPNVIKNGENGYCSNDLDYLVEKIEQQIKNNKAEIGIAARQTIIEKFNLKDFIKNWNEVFDKAYKEKISKITFNELLNK